MKVSSTTALTAAIAAIMLLCSAVANGQGCCDRGGNHTIQVSGGQYGMPSLRDRGGSAEDIHVCTGDQVQCVLIASDREYFVEFMGDAPFPGAYGYGGNCNGVEPPDPRIIADSSAESGFRYKPRLTVSWFWAIK